MNEFILSIFFVTINLFPAGVVFSKGDGFMKKKKLNITATTLSLIYCFVLAYFFLIAEPATENPNRPLWIHSIIPAGVVVIKIFFDYVIKKDYIRDYLDKK
ncbi:hypothetical protein DFR57_103216 [Saliterribacillus persicus]|uniref:Uncharacterized protein n=2 Tax=Saliterribacillus persicus TaxID=930114 RepID=A0A368Y595_9BACI|nr:hypothetical protein DFR57_103216 [Saliterribacillus persicus]